jgi:FixJ family two-component response regulator
LPRHLFGGQLGRESQILRAFADGRTTSEIARSLGISPGSAVPGAALVVMVAAVVVLAALIGATCSIEATRSRRAAGGLVPALELR